MFKHGDLSAAQRLALHEEEQIKGWKLVPVEPTEEMREAVRTTWESNSPASMEQMYKAILAAAPQPPALGGELKLSGEYHADVNMLLADNERLKDELANHDSVSKVMNSWVAEKGQMPWATAIKTMAIITKMPDEERDRLLDMDDGSTERGALIAERDTLKARCEELEGEVAKRDALLDELGCPFDMVSDLYADIPLNAKRYGLLRSRMTVEDFPAPHPEWSHPSEFESSRIDALCDEAMTQTAPAAKDGAQ